MRQDHGPTEMGDACPAAAAGREAPRLWRRLDATLVYDSRLAPPPVGVRAVRAGLPRLIFQAPGYEVDLQVRPGPTADRLRVVGQVLDDEYEPCSGWVIIEGARGVVKAGLDEGGHFAIDGLASGGHWLEVELPRARIALPPVYL